jgi:hypothetical protein
MLAWCVCSLGGFSFTNARVITRVLVIAALYVICHDSLCRCFYDRGKEGGSGS